MFYFILFNYKDINRCINCDKITWFGHKYIKPMVKYIGLVVSLKEDVFNLVKKLISISEYKIQSFHIIIIFI